MKSDDTNRREFLTRLAGLGAVLSLPSGMLDGKGMSSGKRAAGPETLRVPETSSPAARALPPRQALPTREIPGTGERLPIVGFGSSKPVLEIPMEGTEPLEAVLGTLLEQGGRVVDTSPRTPDIDREFGRVLTRPRFRNSLFLAAKINTEGEDAGIAQMRQSQELFGRPTLDLLQVESLRDLDVHWPNVRAWKDSGEARYIGVTVSAYRNFERLEAFMRSESFDFVHVNYSVMEPLAEERILPLAQDLGLAVLTNRPFMNGSYFGRVADHELPEWAAEFDCESWAQFSLKYVLSHPAVTCALTETSNPIHLVENMNSALGRFPDEATKRRMRELVSTF